MKISGTQQLCGAVAVAMAGALLLSSVGAAAAADPVEPGGDISGPGAEMTGAAAVEAQDQLDLTQAYQQLAAGRLTVSDFEKKERAYNEKYGLKLLHPRAPRTAARTSVAEENPYAPPASRTLALTHYAQTEDYYCGPATGAMIIKMIDGSIRSRYNGKAFRQVNLADDDHMATDKYGRTAWDSGRFQSGLDRWRGVNDYQQVDSPSAAKMKGVLQHSIGLNGMPVAGDTVEPRDGARYNDHPPGPPIGHWIAAYGYDSSGARVKWADPATHVWEGRTVHQTFTASTRSFTNTYLQTNGIAY